LFLLLVMMGSLVTILSLLLDNVTTVVIFGPLIILICQTLEVSPIPFLLAAALLSDTGGVATLVGDPPNLMIGSAAGIAAFRRHWKSVPMPLPMAPRVFSWHVPPTTNSPNLLASIPARY